MRKLLLSVLFFLTIPVYGQDYTVTPVEVKPPLQNIYETGGTNLNLADDGMATGIKLGFEFEFYGNKYDSINISNNGFLTFGGTNSMCCNGLQLPSFGMDYSISALWTDLISVDGKNPYYLTSGDKDNQMFTVGWYGTLEFYNTSAPNTFEISLYQGSNNILFNYGDVNVFGHSLTIGLQGDGSKNQFSQIYTGNNANLFDNTSYLFTYTPPEPIQLTPPDCTTNPADISCVIKLNANNVTSDPISYESNRTQVASISSQSEVPNDPQVIGGVPLELETIMSITSQSLDITQEEKEEELKDNIAPEILELALAASTAPTQDIEQERANRTTSNNSTDGNDDSSDIASQQQQQNLMANDTTDNQSASTDMNEQKDEAQESMQVAMQSMTEEQIMEQDQGSEQKDETVELVQISAQPTMTEDQIIEQDQGSSANNDIDILANITQSTGINEEIDNNVINVEDGSVDVESFVAQQINVSNDINDGSNTDTIIANSIKESESNEEELITKIVNDSKTPQQNDEQELTVATTITMPVMTNVPGMNTMFNIEISTGDKERLGLIKPQEDRRSDAEKRAEQVIAANKDQQDQINKDYMNADQSGILGAIASDTDVTAYRTMMIPQNAVWYKSDEIYKNVTYKDNVRNSYFLEKGNTDTYKKMIEEQYKK